jgi:transcriptional regulator with XRE-family HTH domain
MAKQVKSTKTGRGQDDEPESREPETGIQDNAAIDGASGDEKDGEKDIGEFIRQQRERANLSLRRLAERAGISNPYLSQIERGLRKPSAEILKSIARALSIQAESMYARAGLLEEGTKPPTVVRAVEEDPHLNPRQRQVLLDLYRTLLESGVADGDREHHDEHDS